MKHTGSIEPNVQQEVLFCHGLRDQNRLDSVSNFVIWRARILLVLDEYDIKDNAMSVLVVLADPNPLEKFKNNQARTKRLIMDGVKDHVVPHVGRSRSNVPRKLHPAEDVLRESDEALPDAKV